MPTSKINSNIVMDYLRTLCIVCRQPIMHSQTQEKMFSRIAHLKCSRRYWNKKLHTNSFNYEIRSMFQ